MEAATRPTLKACSKLDADRPRLGPDRLEKGTKGWVHARILVSTKRQSIGDGVEQRQTGPCVHSFASPAGNGDCALNTSLSYEPASWLKLTLLIG